MYRLYNYDNWGAGNSFGWLGGGLMMLAMVAFWVLIIGLVAWLIRNVRGDVFRHGKNSDALDILRERYARGEIDKKEFEEKKKDLS